MNVLRLAWPALALVSFAGGCGGQKTDSSGTGGGGAAATTGTAGSAPTVPGPKSPRNRLFGRLRSGGRLSLQPRLVFAVMI